MLSGSMEPGFYRGDILFLNMGTQPIRTGEIVVFNIDGRDIPIVHRVIKVHEWPDHSDVDILTKVRAGMSGVGMQRRSRPAFELTWLTFSVRCMCCIVQGGEHRHRRTQTQPLNRVLVCLAGKNRT